MNKGLKAWQSGDLAGALAVLDRYQPRPGQEDLRGFEWFYLWRLCHSEQLTLSGHSNLVRAVAFSPDARWLLSGGDDGKARVWDAATGREAAVLAGPTDGVSAVAFSPDGRAIASGSRDGTLRLWATGTFRERAVLGVLTNGVGAVAFSPDGRWLAASSAKLAGGSGTPVTRFLDSGAFPAQVRLWDTSEHKEVATLCGHQAGVQAMAFSPDSQTLATASTDGELRFWSVPAGSQQTNVAKFDVPLLAVAFSPDGSKLAIGGGSPYRREMLLRLLDAATGREVGSLKGHRGAVFALAFSPDGETFASAGLDQVVKLWDSAVGTELGEIKGHTASIWSLAFDPTGRRLATGSWDNAVKVWAAKQPRISVFLRGRAGYSCRFSPDGTYLAAGGRTVAVLKVGAVESAFFLSGYSVGDSVVAWSPDGALLATAGTDNLVTLWERGTWRKLAVLEGHNVKIWSLAFSPDGRILASGGDIQDPTLRLWDVPSRRSRAVLRMHGSSVACVAFTPDGQRLVAGSWKELVCVDPSTGAELWRLNEPGPRVAISPDGRWMAVTGKPNPLSLRLVELASKQVRWTIRPHNDGIYAVTFSPDGRTVATASWDGTAKLWNTATGQELFRYDAPGVAWTVAFSPEGRYWAVGSGGAWRGEVTLFQAATDTEINAPPGSLPPAPESELEPEEIEVWRLRAEVLANRGDQAGALAVYDRAIQRHPTNAACWYAKGVWLEKNSRLEEAALTLDKAVQLAQATTNTLVLSQVVRPLEHVGKVLRDQGKVVLAELALRQGLALAIERFGNDNFTTTAIRGDLAQLYVDLGRYAQAEQLYLNQLELTPQSTGAAGQPRLKEALRRLTKVYEATGTPEKVTELQAKVTQSYAKQVESLRQAAAGNDPVALSRLAWLLATCDDAAIRDGPGAVSLAEKAVAASNGQDPSYLDTLAAAYAEAGQFTKAVTVQKEAMNLLQDETRKRDYASRLKLYEANTPYRERD